MKKRAHRWINGTRGAISLLLSLLMLPFFSMAAVLVEAGRYQSAVKALDEALGSSTVSTLADYDGYVQERFGLLAVSQDSDLAATANSYMEQHKLTDLAAVNLEPVTMRGAYPLSDTEVLRRQIMEYSKILVPARMATDGLQIDELVKKLEKATKMIPILKTLSAGCDQISAQADSLEAMEDAKKAAKETKKAISTYQTNFTTWETSVNALIDHLKTSRPTDEEGAKSWDKSEKELRTAAETARKEYLSAITDLIKKLDTLQEKLDDAVAAQAKYRSSAETFFTTAVDSGVELGLTDPNADEQTKKETEQYIKTNSEIQKALSSGSSDISNRAEECLKSFDTQKLLDASAQLQKDETAVTNYNTDGISSGSSAPTAASYRTAQVDGLADADALDKLLDSTVDDMNDNGLLDFISCMLTILNSFFKTKTVFDGELNSKLDKTFYKTNYGGLPSEKDRGNPAYALAKGDAADEQRSIDYLAAIDPDFDPTNPYGTKSTFDLSLITKIMNDLEDAMDAAEDIKDTFGKATKILDFFEALGDFASAVVSLLKHTIQFIEQVVIRVAELIGGAVYERLLLNGYLAYNIPNRTTYKSESTLTGYSFSDIPYGAIPAKELYKVPGTGIVALIQAIANGGGYANKTFTGAELEYILWGFNSEIGNQSMQFMALYLTRLLLDLPALLCNQEVQSYVSLAGPLAPLVAVIYVFGEPYADSLILVNGGDVPLAKTTPFLTIEGLPELVKEFTSLPMSDDMSATISKKASELTGLTIYNQVPEGEKWSGGFLPMNYTEHSLLLMLVFGSENTYLNRLADLIQAESSAYREKNVSLSNRAAGTLKDFNIDESYTVLRAGASGTLVQLLPVPSLSANSVFSVDRVIYRGY